MKPDTSGRVRIAKKELVFHSCAHLTGIRDVTPSTIEGCDDCLKTEIGGYIYAYA
jgi:hypothetical protein